MDLNPIKTILFLILSLVNLHSIFAKEVVVVIKEDPFFHAPSNDSTFEHHLQYRIQYGQDSVSFQSLSNHSLAIDESLCNSQITIEIQGDFLQSYYNQFRCDQLSKLDTIYVQELRSCSMYFPALTNDVRKNFDYDHIFVKQWLEDESYHLKAIFFEVKHADLLSRKDSMRIKQDIHAYCDTIGYSEFSKDIVFSNSPYVTRDNDEFNKGTIITRSFIDEQNTTEMRLRAEKYSLVVLVLRKDD